VAPSFCMNCSADVVGQQRYYLLYASLVGVLGRYSNHADQGKRLAKVLGTAPKELIRPILRTTKQIQRRLKSAEIEELAVAYQAGSTVYELAERFRIHRATVSHLLGLHGIPTRYRLVQGDKLNSAIDAYQDGQSLATIGRRLGVSLDTVRAALMKAGMEMRPRPGWKYKDDTSFQLV
jgi:hypothetical protein